MTKLSNGKQLNNFLAIKCITGQNVDNEADLLLSCAYIIQNNEIDNMSDSFKQYADGLIREQIINSRGQINWNLYEQLKY